MNEVLLARSQMALSLGFHIVFATVGVAMPALMSLAEWRWLKTKDADYLTLTKAWARGTTILFAVGAVSGTVLSFELGLLFPGFMAHAGPLIGMPFSLEGFAFFTEAIFLGLYLYGWERLSPRLHLASGVIVALSGMASAGFVTLVNAWMNAPRGFRLENGKMVDLDPLAAMSSSFAPHEIAHLLLAAYAATGFAVAAVHAGLSLKRGASAFHSKALALALMMGAPAALAQLVVGDHAGKVVAEQQPMKLAAMEGLFKTEAHAPLHLGGVPDYDAHQTRYAIEIPSGLSIFAFNDPAATVKGLEEIPRADWPHPAVHYAFQTMVGCGTLMAVVAGWALVLLIRRRPLEARRWFLRAVVACGPLGFVAIETGWMVTELGRQPWVVYGVIRTAETVTPMPGLIVPFVLFGLVYLLLSATVARLLWRQFHQVAR
ncbi:MAG: cytochrome ubiquinol oxidase subunit I [Myxococcaceae bacterium]